MFNFQRVDPTPDQKRDFDAAMVQAIKRYAQPTNRREWIRPLDLTPKPLTESPQTPEDKV